MACLFVLDDAAEGAWPLGAASRWWLRRSLESLDASLRTIGSRLVVRRGDSIEALADVTRAIGADRVVASARHEPAAVAHETVVRAALARRGVRLELFPGSLLHDPASIRTADGRPFRVFTPFWKACLAHGIDGVPVRAPESLRDASEGVPSLPIEALELDPAIPWDEGLAEEWSPGESGAKARWVRFAREGLAGYATGRDLCGTEGTSRLSPHLHFGEISPRRIWHELAKVERSSGARSEASRAGHETWRESLRRFRAELGWREFAHHVLVAAPETPELPLRREFARFPWSRDESLLRAWRRGRTGYPLVDAGMRQLWRSGWMHNRVRMVVASFLVKHLLQPWQEGARWFWDTLVDADLANNTLGWQWTAGCGADAAPYFRIFNPSAQGERFDANGAYVRRWVPELAPMPDRFIHSPWTAPASLREACAGYPRPIVDHVPSRERALEAFASLRSDGSDA